MVKPRSQAILNPTPEQKLARNTQRIARLKEALKVAKSDERKASLQAEIDRRRGEIEGYIASAQQALADIDA